MRTGLTVVICTHNRARLLERALASLEQARRPPRWSVQVLVISNACTDQTHDVLLRLQTERASRDSLPLRFAVEPIAGKSRALNRAIGLVDTPCVAFVDDDHRVDADYLCAVCSAFESHPEASLFCGRIVPDWDGTEPAWVHDTGPFRIYPLPVPQFGLGDRPMTVDHRIAIPGGGNLCLRSELFATVGDFCIDLGPVGHDLAGAEDTEWIRRALDRGAILRYVPAMLQYHYADSTRLTLRYIIRKAYRRSLAGVRTQQAGRRAGGVPLYMYRKVADYFASALFCVGQRRRRFYLVRLASALGEIQGARLQRRSGVRPLAAVTP